MCQMEVDRTILFWSVRFSHRPSALTRCTEASHFNSRLFKELLSLFGWRITVNVSLCLCVDREKDEDEGVPSETEEDRRQQENRAKEIRGGNPSVLWHHILFYLTNNGIHSFICVSFQSSCEGKTSRSSLYWRRRSTSSETWATVILPLKTRTHHSGSGCYSGPHLMKSQKGSQS